MKTITKQLLVYFFYISYVGFSFSQNYNIYSDFPTGNIFIEKIKNDTIWLKPDLRDTEGDWFYWCFGMENAKDKKITFVFPNSNLFTSKGPAVSYDYGYKWEWLYPDRINFNSNSFTYRFKSNDEVRFSMGMPYSEYHFNTFIENYLNHPALKKDTLTITKGGRTIERVTIMSNSKDVNRKVLFTARHHACEIMANYVMEGIIEEVLKNDDLRNGIEYCFIPFIDKDGVENGDQGKKRIPRDHNRDYSGDAIYNSTSALKKWVPEWANGKNIQAIDLHCPWIRGSKDHEYIHLVGSENSKIAEKQEVLYQLLSKTNKGELKISERFIYPFGNGWNNGQNYTEGATFIKWISSLDNTVLALTLEFPYSVNEKQTINQDNSRDFGRDIINALYNF